MNPPELPGGAPPGSAAEPFAALPFADAVSGLPVPLAVTVLLPVGLLGALALYSRLTRDKAFASPMRRRLLSYLERAPGATASDLARVLDVDYKTVQHHVRVLERFDLVSRVRRGRLIHLYPARWVDTRRTD